MCSKMWPLEGSTRLSSAVRSAPAAEDRLDSRTSTALTRSPPQPFRMSSSTVGFWFGKIFFNTSKGGRLAFKLKGREMVSRWALDQEVALLGVVFGAVRAALGVAPVFLHSGVPTFIHRHDLGALRSEAVLAFDNIWGAPLVGVFVTEGLRSIVP